jgi:hypothetical protein
MKYYLDTDGTIYGYELDGSQDHLIGNKTPVTKEAAVAAIAEKQPPPPPPPSSPTREQLMAELARLGAQISALG